MVSDKVSYKPNRQRSALSLVGRMQEDEDGQEGCLEKADPHREWRGGRGGQGLGMGAG